MEIPKHGHEPVLLRQILELTDPKPGEVVLDCTTGRGGHAAALAQRIKPNGLLLCLDADPVNLEYARERLAGLEVRCRFFQANFAEIQDVLASAGVKTLDVVLADLGVSTNQLLSEKYGLSFSIDGPLDMRLDPRIKRSAADLIATLPEKELADLIYSLAEERYSRRIARAIVEARRKQPILRTAQLAEIVRSVAGHAHHGRIDAATRTFQALRMAVNGELDNLQGLLETLPEVMSPGGRAAVISFHSGEDRLVKQAMREWRLQERCDILTGKPVTADEPELINNPRSRSAKLRVARFVSMNDGKEKMEHWQ
ncbi:MAG TPA: 16S rRNA (cytosine(1402)-N(4))-methyltransferase RsmH [Phycisphaerae bacterium]|nr:16S rRNA (cytosine(1402)-N(4))-methyltransferase RsmH [Phycisphaerae bacterium]